MKSTPQKREKRVRAWAVIGKDGLSTVANSFFKNNTANPFAVYPMRKDQMWNERILQEFELTVVPCTITYSLPKRKMSNKNK